MNAKAKTYSIETNSFDSTLYGQPWIAVADFSKSTDDSPEPDFDFYGEGVQPSAGFSPAESNTPGSYGRVQIMCEPGTILCHGITRRAAPGQAKPEVSRLWYIAADHGEAVSLLPMGGFAAARRLAALPMPERLDGFRMVKAMKRGDGGAGMVGPVKPAPRFTREHRSVLELIDATEGIEEKGLIHAAEWRQVEELVSAEYLRKEGGRIYRTSKPAPLAEVDRSPVALEFSDYQALQRALCRGVVDCESAIKLHSGTEDGDDTERKERRAYLVASYEKELAEYQGLKAKLRSVYIDGAPGRMVSI